jgi:hypothetical protein
MCVALMSSKVVNVHAVGQRLGLDRTCSYFREASEHVIMGYINSLW